MTNAGMVNDVNEGRMPATLEYARTIIESAPVGIVTFDGAGQCISANRASARILGLTIEKLLSQNYTSLKAWKSSGLLGWADATMTTGRGHRACVDFKTGLGLSARLDCQFERFVSGGHRYLLQIIVESGGVHG